MSFGIDTHNFHLNDDALDWGAFSTFTSQSPVFAGRYFNSQTFSWCHGEGITPTSLTDTPVPAELVSIAPIQSGSAPSEVTRQQTTGPNGYELGTEDAIGFCGAIGTALKIGDLTNPSGADGTCIYVFLEVADNTNISSDYWSGWASLVKSYMAVLPNSGFVTLLPCIMCSFSDDGSGDLVPPIAIQNAMTNGTSPNPPVPPITHFPCSGFWAITQNTTNYTANPPDIPSGLNSVSIGNPAVSIDVLIWQYAQAAPHATSLTPNLNLDVTLDDSVVGQLLGINTSFAISLANPTSLGIDTAAQITTANVGNLLGAPPAGSTAPSQPATISFAFRYYKPRPPASNLPTLTTNELSALRANGLLVGSVYQVLGDGTPIATAAGYLTAATGQQHATDALTQANAIGQPAYTPIFFGIDWTVQSNGDDVNSLEGSHVTDYFSGVYQALQTYLAGVPGTPPPTPYLIGVYGCAYALSLCYAQGYVNYFWQVYNTWGGVGGTNSKTLWPHTNLLQHNITLAMGTLGVDIDWGWGDEGIWRPLPQ